MISSLHAIDRGENLSFSPASCGWVVDLESTQQLQPIKPNSISGPSTAHFLTSTLARVWHQQVSILLVLLV